jgi:hypothetical protein
MADGWTIKGQVRGNVMFPDHPDHMGGWGLCGGEDISAERSTFRSVGEAMTWCRQILDGLRHPRTWTPAGELLKPRTEPRWYEATVTATPGRGSVDIDDLTWVVAGRDWRVQLPGDRLGKVVRTDRRVATLEDITPNEEYL